MLGQDAGDLDGALAFDTAATRRSGVGTYAVTAGGLTSGNYAISYAPGTLTVDPRPLTVTADDASRPVGDAEPALHRQLRRLRARRGPRAISTARSRFATDADRRSAAGDYAITPGGLSSGNYAIAFVDGTLTVAPQTPVPATRASPTRWGASGVEPYARGVPPLTPGDASFRTTVAEAPPALANPFDLTYSLGEIVQLAPDGGGPDSRGLRAGRRRRRGRGAGRRLQRADQPRRARRRSAPGRPSRSPTGRPPPARRTDGAAPHAYRRRARARPRRPRPVPRRLPAARARRHHRRRSAR